MKKNKLMYYKNLFFTVSMILFLGFSCQSPNPRYPVSQNTSVIDPNVINLAKENIKNQEQLFKKIISQDSTANYISSEYGFYYKILEGDSLKNTPNIKGMQLSYTCDIFDVHNTIIYDSKDVGFLTYYVDEQEIIYGLQEGLKLMDENDTFVFLFPSHVAFGYAGDGDKIGINQPLKYKVKLFKINNK